MGLIVVAISAYVDKPNLDRCFEVGMVEAIQKPINSTLIDQLILKYARQLKSK